MSVKRKPSPGVCGKCGRAVVRPEPAELSRRISNAQSTPYTTPTTVTVSGHEFDMDGRLLKVRCFNHVDPPDGW